MANSTTLRPLDVMGRQIYQGRRQRNKHNQGQADVDIMQRGQRFHHKVQVQKVKEERLEREHKEKEEQEKREEKFMMLKIFTLNYG